MDEFGLLPQPARSTTAHNTEHARNNELDFLILPPALRFCGANGVACTS